MTFHPIPAALVDDLRRQALLLELAQTTDDQIKALFMAHCVLERMEAALPKDAVPKEFSSATTTQ